jgi:tetratricopeptide (TPR) repeat protein
LGRRSLLTIGGCALAGVAGLMATFAWTADDGAEALEAAQAYYRQGDLSAARVQISDALKSGTSSSATHVLEAQIALGLFDGVGARNALKHAVDSGATPASVAHLLGHALWLEGEGDKAKAQLLRADIPGNNKAYALRILGRVQMDDGDFVAAQLAFERALQLAPQDSLIWTDFARLRFAVADRKGAIEAVDKALKLAPNEVRAIEFRGQLVRDQFGVVAALPWFERGLQIQPNDLPLLEQYGLTLGDAGRYRDMLSTARKIMRLDAGNPNAFYMQAVLAARAGDYSLSARLLQRTNSAFRERPGPMLLAAITEYELQNFNRAVDVLQRLLAMQPDNMMVRTLMAQAMYRAGDPFDALDAIKPIAVRTDADTYAFMLTARAFEASDQAERSFAPLNEASISIVRKATPLPEAVTLDAAADEVRRTPDNARTMLPYIRLLLANQDTDMALAQATRLQAGNQGVPDAHLIVGDVLAARGDYLGALGAYQKAREISFTGPVMLRITDALVRTGKHRDASETVSQFLAYNPENLTALRLAGYYNLDAAKWTEAVFLLNRLVGRVGDNDPILMINLARAFAGAGQAEEAERHAEIAYRIMPANAFITVHYGRILLKAGNRPKAALELFQKADALMGPDVQLAKDLVNAKAAFKKSAKRQ